MFLNTGVMEFCGEIKVLRLAQNNSIMKLKKFFLKKHFPNSTAQWHSAILISRGFLSISAEHLRVAAAIRRMKGGKNDEAWPS